MRTNKKAFTLLEIMLVISLIGLTLGLIGTQAPKAFKVQTFECAIDQVKTRIMMAQRLMLDYQTDVILTLIPMEEGLECNLKACKPITQKFYRNLNRHDLIKGIEAIAFDGVFTHKLELYFDATLGATPKGKIFFKGGHSEIFLTLKGFPSQILRGEHVIQEPKAIYPKTILSLI